MHEPPQPLTFQQLVQRADVAIRLLHAKIEELRRLGIRPKMEREQEDRDAARRRLPPGWRIGP